MNTELIYNIIRYSMLAIDIAVILTGLGYIGFGFLWGFRKNLRRMLSFIVPFLIFVIFIGLISKLIMNADISFLLQGSDKTTIKELAAKLIAQYLYEGNTELANNSKIIELAEAVALAGIKLTVYLIGLLVTAFIVAPIIRFCAWLTYRISTAKKEKKRVNIVSRCAGMGIGGFRYGVFLFLIVIPMLGFISTTSLALEDLISVTNVINIEENNSSELANEDPIDLNVIETIETVHKALNKSFLKKVIGLTANSKTGVTFDAYYLGEMVKVRTSDTKINIVNEYGHVRNFIPLIEKVIKINYSDGTFKYEFNYQNLTENDIDQLIEAIKNVDSLDALLPIGLEFGCYIIESQNLDETLGIDIESLKQIDLNKDFNLLMDSIGILSKAVLRLEIDFNKPQEALTNNALPGILEEFFNTVLQTELVNKVALPIGVNQLIKMLEEQNNPQLTELIEMITLENVTLCLENDISPLFSVFQKAYDTDLKDYFNQLIENPERVERPKIDFDDPKIQELIQYAITTVMDLKIIVGNEEILIKTAFNIALKENNYGIVIEDLLYNNDGTKKINWKTEPEILGTALVNLLVLVEPIVNEERTTDDILDIVLTNRNQTKLVMENISASDIVRTAIVELLPKILQENAQIPAELKDVLSFEVFEKFNDQAVFSAEMKLLVDILYDANDIGLLDFETFAFDSTKKEQIINLLNNILDSALIKGNEEKLFKMLVEKTPLNDLLTNNDIILEYHNVTDWNKETKQLVEVIMSYMEIADSDSFSFDQLFASNMMNEDIEKVATLFENISKSQLFGPIIYQLIDQIGYDINITEEDKIKIEENTWYTEITTVLKTKGEAQAMLEDNDLSSVQGSQIKSIMLSASEGIIASKIVGTIITNAIGPDGLDINPVDGEGESLYDFTDPQTLKDRADEIADLVDAVNGLDI